MSKLVLFFATISAVLFASSLVEYASAAEIIVDMPAGSGVMGCEMTNSCFIPHEAFANVGDSVKWENSDAAAHTVTSGGPMLGPDGEFDSGLIAPGSDFAYAFVSAGTFPYYCAIHPWMVGTVEVSAAGPPIIVSTDKRSYLDGETVTISGTITTIVPGQDVVVQILSPMGVIVRIDIVAPVGNAYSHVVVIGGALWSDIGSYTVRAMYGPDTIDTTFTREASEKDQILTELNAAKTLVQGDSLMDAADKLLDIRYDVEAEVKQPKRDVLLEMIDSTINSYLVASTPGSVHEYPVSCDTHEIEAEINNPPSGQLVVIFSNATHPVYESDTWKFTTTDALGETRCIPHLIRGATVASGAIDYDGGSFTIDINTRSDGKIIVSLPRSLVDSKKPNGEDEQFTVHVDTDQVNNFKDNSTETIRILEIPFVFGSDEIIITGSPKGGPTPTPTPPGPPTRLLATAQSDTKIDLSWIAPAQDGGAPITGYTIERLSPTSAGFEILVADTGNTDTEYSDMGLDPNTTYTYKVSAINSAGAGSSSNESSATTLSGGVPLELIVIGIIIAVAVAVGVILYIRSRSTPQE